MPPSYVVFLINQEMSFLLQFNLVFRQIYSLKQLKIQSFRGKEKVPNFGAFRS